MLFFCLFECFEGKEYQTESKQNETFESDLFGTKAIQGTWSGHKATNEVASRVPGVPLGVGAPPPSWAPIAPPTYFFLLHIPTYPKNIQEHHEKLFPPPQPFVSARSHLGAFVGGSAGGGIDHGGPLHHLQGLSDEL